MVSIVMVFSLCSSAVFADPVSTAGTITPTDTEQSSVSGTVQETTSPNTAPVKSSDSTGVTSEPSSVVKEDKSTSTKTDSVVIENGAKETDSSVSDKATTIEETKEDTTTTTMVEAEDKTEEVVVTEDSEDVIVKDKTTVANKDGINLVVTYTEDAGFLAYVPKFTLELRSKTGKTISTVEAGKQNYSVEEGAYKLVLPNTAGYKLGDEYQIMLTKKDSIIKNITLLINYVDNKGSWVNQTAPLTVGKYYPFSISSTERFTDDNETKKVRDYSITSSNPMLGELKTDSSKVGIYLVNKSGAPVKGATVSIKTHKETFTAKSDDSGLVLVNSNRITNEFILSSADKTIVDGVNNRLSLSRPIGVLVDTQNTVLTYRVVVDNKVSDDASEVSQGSGIVSVSVTDGGNSDLSGNWKEFDLTFTDNKGGASKFTINGEGAEIGGLADGTYTVKASGEYANAVLSANTVTVKDGKGSLKVTVNPKYTLAIDKDGESYKFSFLNVDSLNGKVFSGKEEKVYAVTPGESFMVKDNVTGEVFTIAIDANSARTKLVLGAGVVFGGSATSPHTGDGIVFLLVMFAVALAGAVGSFIAYQKRRAKTGGKTAIVSGILVVALVAQLLASFGSIAHADTNIGSGTPVNTGGGSSSPKGVIQTDPNISVMKISFLPSYVVTGGNKEYQLTENAGLSPMANDYKFKSTYNNFALYMASNKASNDVFRNSNSSILSFNNGKVSTVSGKNQLFTGGDTGSETKADTLKRTLPYGTQGIESNNAFEQFMAYAMEYMSDDPSDTRQLWKGNGSLSIHNVGDAISDSYTDWIADKLKGDDRPDWMTVQGQINMALILQGYLDKLKSAGHGAEADQIAKIYSDDISPENDDKIRDIVLVVQVLPAFYVKGESKSSMAFMPFHDASQWYRFARAKETTKFDNVNENHEAQIVYGVSGNGSDGREKGGSASSAWAKLAPTSTFTYNVRPTTGAAAKPKSTAVPIASGDTNTKSALSKNPFTGWGYLPWGYVDGDAANKPKIDVFLNVEVEDENGNVTTSFQQALPGWEEDKVAISSIGTTAGLESVQGSMAVKRDGKTYLLEDQVASFTLKDKTDKENLLSVKGLQESGPWSTKVSIPQDKTSRMWYLDFGFDLPDAPKLNAHLGGVGAVGVKSKWAPDTKKYTNARLVLTVRAKEKIIKKENDANHEVPEWRLSKYWDNIANKGMSQSTFDLSLPSQTFESPSLSPSGSIMFRLIDPNLSGAKWALSKAKLFNDTPSKQINVYSTSAAFNEAGDLLAIKENSSVSPIKLADWKNNFSLYNGRIGAASGITGGSPIDQVIKKFLFKYGVESPYSTYTYSETRYRTETDSKGRSRQVPYRWSGTASQSTGTADYDTSVVFNRYLPEASGKPKAFSPDSKSINGKYWETEQESTTLNVNPEILMAYDDTAGNTSVAFAAGDKLRQVKPVTFNLAQYVNVDVNPEVSGMSVATDMSAKKLAERLNSGGKEVIYKGAALTTNFKVKGELELKTFALDIGSSSLKNAWNPGTKYSTEDINNKFLSEYAVKDASTGKWLVNLTATGKLKVGDGADAKEYAGKKSTLKAPQESVNVKEHTLEVRGGKLVGVDGNRNLDKLDPQLEEALTNMKILGDDNIFNTFERGEGDKQTESKVASLGNAVRGTSSLAVGKGWYNEDSTILIVREYTNVFTLPFYPYVDKLPMEIDGLTTPIDKMTFFENGKRGHTQLTFEDVNAKMTYDSSASKPFGGKYSVDYIVPDVSVMDTFSSQ
jgi:hypothetical protein